MNRTLNGGFGPGYRIDLPEACKSVRCGVGCSYIGGELDDDADGGSVEGSETVEGEGGRIDIRLKSSTRTRLNFRRATRESGIVEEEPAILCFSEM